MSLSVFALRRVVIFTVFAGLCASAAAQAPIVQPGKPGDASRVITAEEAIRLASVRYSAADVKFMQDMIPHHHQALIMSELARERAGDSALRELAERIHASQKDEIAFMQDWLAERGEHAPEPDAHHAMHMSHDMAGMASPEDLERLAALRGADFDRLFLELMIEHHEGALKMVEALLETDGSAHDPVLFEFTTEVTNDQTAEIERMVAMLASYSPDPRAGLAAGFRDAGEAIWNLELVAALPRPDGFFDPENPSGLPWRRIYEQNGDPHGEADPEDDTAEAEDPDADQPSQARAEDKTRSTLLDFSNTDMAFAGDILVAGNYHGFNIYDLSGDVPELVSSVVCPGGQGDVSIVGDLVLVSVEQTRARIDCGLEGTVGKVSEERFRGLRIFDISDLTAPRQVGGVQTCRGSHTHTVVSGPDEDGRVIVYNSGTSSVRDDEELADCSDQPPHYDEGTALFRIDVIEIPVDDPASARIIDSPAVFADPETGRLAGLWAGGDHGEGTQETRETNQCHDITVFPAKNLAAGACAGNGILFDISDPRKPKRITEVVDPGFAYWHSATFNNDGTKVIFTDEWGGGMRPRCRASDPMNWGADAIYDIVDGELEFRSYFKIPAPQSEQENCVAHNGSIIPVPGRDLFVQAWYQGGVTVIDFTDSANPVEIAWFDRGPIDDEDLILGGYWSTYWYRDRIYGTEIVRGLDVFALVPSEHLSESEIAAAAISEVGDAFNPQLQEVVTWPDHPVVARAYVDQLVRSGDLSTQRRDTVESLLVRVESALESGGSDNGLGEALVALATEFHDAGRDGADLARKRMQALAGTLERLAQQVG